MKYIIIMRKENKIIKIIPKISKVKRMKSLL